VADTNSGWSEGTKWVAGVAATIVGGVILFLAVGPGGWFNPDPTPTPPPPAEALISISEFDAPIVMENEEWAIASFTIANEGDAVARTCSMAGDVSPFGEEFSIQPHAVTTVEWGLHSFELQPDTYDFTVSVQCANASSVEETRSITVV
jgi:hypothetical protein